jgi:hypothetical protein
MDWLNLKKTRTSDGRESFPQVSAIPKAAALASAAAASGASREQPATKGDDF